MRTVLSAEQRDAFIQELHARTTSPGFHFLSAEHLQELNGLVSDGAPVLSLYMTLDPEARSGDAWRITFKDLSRQALTLADEQDADRAAVQAELDRIEAALERALAYAEAPGAPPLLAEALRHALFPGGARVRARLCLA
ncbi:MAG: hypothetical protein AAGN64_15615, partial [Bacteroidota bacterium]